MLYAGNVDRRRSPPATYFPAVAGRRTEICSSEWVKPIYTSRASNRKVLFLAKKTRLLKSPSEDKDI
jgi:hypothetical protein